MRLWHYKLIPVLPNKMLISQWRECIAIKRQLEKGTLKNRLISYVMKYEGAKFYFYTDKVATEMERRNIKFQYKYLEEIYNFCYDLTDNIIKNKEYKTVSDITNYPEHNDRYLNQCCFNLQEKYDRGIITKEEWDKIEPILFKIEIHKTISKEGK